MFSFITDGTHAFTPCFQSCLVVLFFLVVFRPSSLSVNFVVFACMSAWFCLSTQILKCVQCTAAASPGLSMASLGDMEKQFARATDPIGSQSFENKAKKRKQYKSAFMAKTTVGSMTLNVTVCKINHRPDS